MYKLVTNKKRNKLSINCNFEAHIITNYVLNFITSCIYGNKFSIKLH